ncbi:MAG: hypothetical protein KJ000_13710 [Pirellulaceae bacterium]|nr:hypothetical protein [Pirellulaceae bacterium]
MTFGHIIWNQQAAIVGSSHMAILHGMLDTYSRCGQRGSLPQEPDFVAALVLDSTPLIYNALKAVFTPYRIAVSVASVFCHQTPQVTHSLASKSCELGDLLFAHIHTDLRGKVCRNALLYQAKMSSKQPYVVPRSETHQLALYTDWPQFSYKSPGALAGTKRDINPKVPHTGAQYMLIDDRPPNDPQSGLLNFPGTYPIGSCMADKCLHDHNHLAQELFDLLRLRSGKAFEAQNPNPPTDEWSRTIWDLIRVALNKAFNRKNSGRNSDPRTAGGPLYLADGACFTAATARSAISTVTEILGDNRAARFFEPPAEEPPREGPLGDDDREPDAGVSLVLIETSEAREEEEERLTRR